MFSSRDIVPIIDVFCNFGNNFLDLGFVIFSFFLLLDHFSALYLSDTYFCLLHLFYLLCFVQLALNFLPDHHFSFLSELLCFVNAPSLEGVMLCPTHQSLNQAILNQLLVGFIFVKSLAPSHNGFVSLISLKLSNCLSDGFPIQTGLRFIDFF